MRGNKLKLNPGTAGQLQNWLRFGESTCIGRDLPCSWRNRFEVCWILLTQVSSMALSSYSVLANTAPMVVPCELWSDYSDPCSDLVQVRLLWTRLENCLKASVSSNSDNRLPTKIGCRDCITPLVKDIHCLPNCFQAKLKHLDLTFKMLIWKIAQNWDSWRVSFCYSVQPTKIFFANPALSLKLTWVANRHASSVVAPFYGIAFSFEPLLVPALLC